MVPNTAWPSEDDASVCMYCGADIVVVQDFRMDRLRHRDGTVECSKEEVINRHFNLQALPVHSVIKVSQGDVFHIWFMKTSTSGVWDEIFAHCVDCAARVTEEGSDDFTTRQPALEYFHSLGVVSVVSLGSENPIPIKRG